MAPSTHSADVSQIQTDTTAILVDTGTTIPATIATVDGNVDSILVDTGTTIPATIATVDANVDTIKTVSDNSLPIVKIWYKAVNSSNSTTAWGGSAGTDTVPDWAGCTFYVEVRGCVAYNAVVDKLFDLEVHGSVLGDVGATQEYQLGPLPVNERVQVPPMGRQAFSPDEAVEIKTRTASGGIVYTKGDTMYIVYLLTGSIP